MQSEKDEGMSLRTMMMDFPTSSSEMGLQCIYGTIVETTN